MSMANTQVLYRYAHALYELASTAGEVDRVADELAVLRSHVQDHDELRLHLGSPRLTRASKRRLLLGVMGMDLSDLTRRVISLLVDKGRAVDAAELGPVFTDVAMVAAGRAVAQVTSATPLDEDQRAKLVQQLNQITGKTVTLEESVDTDLLGGVKILLGSQMIDGSLRRRLERLGETLFHVPLGMGF